MTYTDLIPNCSQFYVFIFIVCISGVILIGEYKNVVFPIPEFKS